MMIHTIFFDVGGTLVTSNSTLEPLAERLDSKRKNEIYEFIKEIFMSMYLQEKPAHFQTIQELLAVSIKEASRKFNLPDISDEVEEVYRNNHLINNILYEDTLPTIEKLRKEGIKLVLISDADADVLVEQLRRLGILKYFDGVIISSRIRAYKPSDTTVKEALKYCDEPLSGILFVGDNVVDMKTAEKMKVKSALIRRNGRFSVDADYKITNLNQIFDIISEAKRK